ncbi:MAG TPA: L,D-transpeptidase [Rhizobiaceae bacterium]|nr:L,D-transpeptidase [Rhizobiaceae bacterium]
MKKAISLLGALALAAPITVTSAPAQAETFLQKFFRAGQPASPQSYRASDKSPVRRKEVAFSGYDVGTIVIDTSDRRLYHVTKPGRALAYGVGVGRDGFTWTGTNKISRKQEWPGWTPPARMRAREAAKGRILPEYMPGGPDNPLGARAMYLGSTLFRIHGTNQPWTIGQAMSSGCIRMANDDVKHLYDRVEIGTKVVVRH